MKNYLIFVALFCYGIVEIMTSNARMIWTVLVVLLLLRVSFLKRPIILVAMLLVGAAFFTRVNVEVPVKPNVKEARLVIFPDHVKVNGDLISGDTKINSQNVKFFYKLKSKQEKQIWSNLSDPIEILGSMDKVEEISTNRNPSEFNYQRFLNNKNIYYSIKLSKVNNLKPYRSKTILEKINVLRIHLIKRLNQLPTWLKIHSQSLLLGYSNDEEKEFFNSLSVLGIIHLFSLSGLHVLIFVTFFRKLLSTIKLTREITDYFLLLLLPMYGVLVGSKIGIWRAIILSLIGILISKSKLQFSRLDVFSITLLICLFVQPKSILDMGGQLSFLLSFALLFIYDSGHVVMTTFKLNLVSLPIICSYTYQFSWLVLLANLLFVPFFSYVILPTTLISAVFPNLSFWKFINNFFEVIYSFLEVLSKNNDFILITGKLSLIVVLFLIVLSLFNLETNRIKNKYLVGYIVLLTFTIIFNKYPLTGQVSLIDVGQGDSILVTTPFIRKVFLIDTGGKILFPQKEWQKRENKNQVEISTIPYLKSQGISKIDKVFLSHKDVDHMGNLPTLLNKFPVSEVNFGTGLEDNKSIKKIINDNSNVKFSSLRQGDIFKEGNIEWNILWPKKRSIGENGDSLTILANIHGNSWLFTGDLDISNEQKILDDYKIKVDYLKAGHHGSKTSSGDDFLKQVNPNLALISAGVNNRYGHPNKETIDRYNKYNVSHMNTADYGMITWYYYPFIQGNKIKTFLKGEVIENIRIKK